MKKVFVVFILVALAGCGGSTYKKRQLAQSLFTQASLEINNYQAKNDTNALRKALNDIDQSLSTHSTLQARGLKATILYQLGKLEESRQLFEQLLKEKTLAKAKRADVMNNYAIVLYQLGNTAEAEHIWTELINNAHYISPELAYFNLGYVQLNEAAKQHAQNNADQVMQHLEQALTCFKNALSISKEYIDALFFAGQALMGLNKLDEACDCYKTILTINPEHQTATQLLQYLEHTLTQAPHF